MKQTWLGLGLVVGLSGCGSAEDPAARIIGRIDGSLALNVKAAIAGADTRAIEALRARASSVSDAFVVPEMTQRVATLSSSLAQLATTPGFEGATWLALSSDGHVLASHGQGAPASFTNVRARIPEVVPALVSGEPRSTHAAWPADAASTGRALVHIVPVMRDGAIVGALVTASPLASEAARMLRLVRSRDAVLASAGVCVVVADDVACEGMSAAHTRASGAAVLRALPVGRGARLGTDDRAPVTLGIEAERFPRRVVVVVPVPVR